MSVAAADGLGKIEEGPRFGETQELLDIVGGELGADGGEQAVEKGEGVAHGACAGFGDGQECVGVGGDFFGFGDFGEVLGDLARGDVAEVVALAAGEYGGGDFFRFGGGEDELDVRRRLFKGFEQGVEGGLTEHVGFVDDVDLEAAAGGAELGVGDEIADVVDAGVAGGVDLDDVDVIAPADGEAGGTFAAGLGGWLVGGLAVEAFGEDAGGGGFSGAAGSAEEKGVSEPAGGDGAGEGLSDLGLADEIVEGGRAITAGEDGVRLGIAFVPFRGV